MMLSEFKQKIKDASFQDSNGIPYKFIPENTLKFGHSNANLVNYEIYEEEGSFYLKHNSLFGTEDMSVEITNENPLTIALAPRFSKNKNIILKQLS